MVTSANACLRWLAAQNLARAQQSAVRIVADGQRAADTITRIRALAQNAPAHTDWLDLNATIRDVLALARSDVYRHGVLVETHLAEEVPRILGDRIQVQQVLLNLVMNAIEALSGVSAEPRRTPSSPPGCAIPGRGWSQRVASGCSRPSIRPSRRGWAWGWRSAVGLSKRMAAGCGPQHTTTTARPFTSPCQPRRGIRKHDRGTRYGLCV